MLNATATSIPYAFSAAKYATLQSRAARLILGVAVRSVRQFHRLRRQTCSHWPRMKESALEPGCVERSTPAASVIGLPPAPIARAKIVNTAPLESARMPVKPLLISSSNAFAMLYGCVANLVIWC